MDDLIRPARAHERDAINAVIGAAVMGWALPERVKRLVRSSYEYSPFDMAAMTVLVAADGDEVRGVAALETLATRDRPDDCAAEALLLHGLFVHPEHHHRGIGTALWRACRRHAETIQACGLLVRAQADAVGFFIAQGMAELPVTTDGQKYPHQFWLPTGPPAPPGK